MSRRSRGALILALGLAPAAATAQPFTPIYSQTFDSLTPLLGSSVNERLSLPNFPLVTRVASDPVSAPLPAAFSKTGPAGWTVNNNLGTYLGAPTVGNTGVPGQGVADYGVDEWEGWSFASKSFWAEVAGDQDRNLFTNGSGTIAVVDPDEYYDLGDPDNATNGGFYNSSLSTPFIAAPSGSIYTLSFDSSWRDEAFDDDHPNPALNPPNTADESNNQAVEVIAVFDNGLRQSRLSWNSDPASPAFKNDTPNERLSFNFGVPAGATSVRFEFNIANAANDWWWAVDNLAVTNLSGGGSTVWSENFDSTVTLESSVNERRSTVAQTSKVTQANNSATSNPVPNAFTKTAPDGWAVDSAGTPSLGDDNVGVFEWEGWSFATPEFWTFADRQQRETFTKGTGVVAIADGDEWDDLGNPDAGGTVPLQTLMTTPVLPLPAIAPGDLLAIQFDSSWRAEDGQTATLLVSLDGGTPTEVFSWGSDDTAANFKPDATNETALYTVDASGASTAQFSFRYSGADDWWWAIDNVQIGVVPEPTSFVLLALAGLSLGVRRR